MGHRIGKAHHPRKGSLGYSPRVRASRPYPRIVTWPAVKEPKLLGFAGYKAGMRHAIFVDNSTTSITKGDVISVPVTILDVPKIKVYAIRVYDVNKRYQKNCIAQITSDKSDKELARKISVPKKHKNPEEECKKMEASIGDKTDVTALVYTLPKGRVGKKKPEIFEIGIGGNNIKEKFDYAKSVLGKEVSVKDVIKAGDQIDIFAVTKGKGFQGPVKRFGVKLQSDKTSSTRRGTAVIGPDRPRKVSWRIAMGGQMGYHNRYDLNKQVLKIGDNGSEISPVNGFLNYGNVSGDYVIIRGSIPGAAKRLIRLRLAVRPNKTIPNKAPELLRISGVEKK
jgi:large subunit ribosomal protein L3